MIVTKKTRYDYRDNIISESRVGEEGEQVNVRKNLVYDKNGNISSVEISTEFIFPGKEPTPPTVVRNEYEYQYFNNDWKVAKVTENGNITQVTKYIRAYETQGYEESESNITRYIYADTKDENGNSILVNTVNFETYQLTEDKLKELKERKLIREGFEVPEGFEVYTYESENNSSEKIEDIKILFGSSDYCVYNRHIEWVDNVGTVKESYWKETENLSNDRSFNEFFTQYKLDKDYNITEVEIEEDFIGKVTFGNTPEGNLFSSKEVINDQYNLPFYFYNIEEERDYGMVDVFLIEDSNHDVVIRREVLNSTQELINSIYYRVLFGENDETTREKHVPKLTEFEKIGLDYYVTRSRTEEEDGSFHEEKYLYDDFGRMIMKTVHDKSVDDAEYEGHIIYEYDKDGKCILDVSENTITNYLFDEKGRKIFTITNTNYPLAKDVFDSYYNKILQSV